MAAHYARVLAEQERTGASMRQLASRYGVSVGHLYWWRRRLRERAAPAGGLVAVDVVGRTGTAGSAVASGGYEIVLPNGVSVRAPRGFEVSSLRELLAAARSC